MGLFVTITFHHVRRDANEATHVLAREERRLSEEWLWIEEAPELVERMAAVDW
ncbi:hypothetical protein Golax_023101, partial [Gossypium laxum]|nr:hypothetical protein [Gossypium laxum]